MTKTNNNEAAGTDNLYAETLTQYDTDWADSEDGFEWDYSGLYTDGNDFFSLTSDECLDHWKEENFPLRMKE